jgi:DNA-binding PadR family transcriptional regulator
MSVKFSILALLAEEPMYGHQLKQQFETRTGSTWTLNIGQVYTTLTRLQRDGFVSEGEIRPDHSIVYSLTPTGRSAVDAWWAEPVDRHVPGRDELAIKIALAVTAPGVDVRAVIQTQREQTQRILQQYTWLRSSIPSNPDVDDQAWLIVVEHLIYSAEAEAHWLDHIEHRLTRLAAPAG